MKPFIVRFAISLASVEGAWLSAFGSLVAALIFPAFGRYGLLIACTQTRTSTSVFCRTPLARCLRAALRVLCVGHGTLHSRGPDWSWADRPPFAIVTSS